MIDPEKYPRCWVTRRFDGNYGKVELFRMYDGTIFIQGFCAPEEGLEDLFEHCLAGLEELKNPTTRKVTP